MDLLYVTLIEIVHGNIEISEGERTTLRISNKQKRIVKVFSCPVLFETHQVQAFSTQALKASKPFARNHPYVLLLSN